MDRCHQMPPGDLDKWQLIESTDLLTKTVDNQASESEVRFITL